MQNINNGKNNNLVAGIDIGSENIYCAIGSIAKENSTIKLLGIGSRPVNESYKKGAITNRNKLIEQFHNFMVDNDDNIPDNELGDIDSLQGVRKFPARVKCAGLAWSSLKKAIGNIKN